jgi:8-oxo-dGTP diphosphatase
MRKKSYAYPRPALTIDLVVFGYQEGALSILLIQRGIGPFLGNWALPGGFVQGNETLEETARRELCEETGIKDVFLEQLYTFDAINRDPRERVITIAYYALVDLGAHSPEAATDATDARWFSLQRLPQLAFDHDQIVLKALERLRSKVRYSPIGFELLPKEFTLTELQTLYETILDLKLDKRNFRKKLLESRLLLDLGKKSKNVPFRAPSLYCFNQKNYRRLEKEGFEFRF